MVGFSMQPYGIQGMAKEGHQHLSGLDEAVLKNIDACKQLSTITRTSFGPNGMNKMVINHLDKLFITNDAATIVNELEVQHPAAKILVLAGKAQQEEIGDGANLTISFAGELLQNAEELIRMGLHPSEIISGYTKAINKSVEILEDLVEKGSENMNEDKLCPLTAEACIQVCPKNPANFNVDNVRVAKLLGGGRHDSTVVWGMVLKNDAVGTIKRMEKAKVPVFAGGVDTSATETKGTVLIHNAEQVEELIKAVAESGAKVIVSGAAVGEMALHFFERYKLMVLKISSKFELRRFCRTTGAIALLKLSQPNPDDLGYIDSISVEEIGGIRVTVVKNEQGGNSVSTIVLRGSTDSILDDLERAVDDGVNTYKLKFHDQENGLAEFVALDSQIIPGAAATEIELARRLKEFSFRETGLDQYAIAKFGESFEMVPKTLAENAGLNAMEIISSLYAETPKPYLFMASLLSFSLPKTFVTRASSSVTATSSTDTLEEKFGRKGIKFLESSDVPVVELTVRNGSSLKLQIPNGHVTSYRPKVYWKDNGFEEVSEPNSQGSALKTSEWTVKDVDSDSIDALQVELSCSSGTVEISYVVSLYPLKMATAVIVKNNGRKAINLNTALLSHFMSKKRSGTGVQGLRGCSYCTHPPLSSPFGILSLSEAMKSEDPGLFSFGWEPEKKQGIWSVQDVPITVLKHKLSRIYAAPLIERSKPFHASAPSKYETIDQGRELFFRVIRMGFDEIYLSSPGSLSDKYGKDYFICTGPASMLVPVTVNPGEEWRGAQVIEHDNL
ncbi:CCT-theta [Forsythia ovata]|uniref:CCT-theta n=1 Tax=Forsythia ovata TaxID=205694 RepID=A0ABD1PLL8_9LAMI